ncbi:hypothetical protein PAMA_013621 [Pampus argenteus]
MEITALCTLIASLRVLPNRSQFFQYESLVVSCGEVGDSSQWNIKRNRSTNINEDCPTSWDMRNESVCVITALYLADTGTYWCESGAGECSAAVNITVTTGPVILDSPAVPVMQGHDVTLHCSDMMTSSSNLTTDFYKDGFLIGTSSTGNMIIHSVSKSDEGLYKCNISGVGESPASWLTVRAAGPGPSRSLLVCFLLPVVGSFLLLASLLLLYLWRNHKGKDDADVSYTDVIITQKVKPKRIRGD